MLKIPCIDQLLKPCQYFTNLFHINTIKKTGNHFILYTWYIVLQLTSSLYRSVLVILHDKVMPHMTNPLLLSDFLTESYNIGE
jgi:U3 small nucleolar RNA-associated protein 19